MYLAGALVLTNPPLTSVLLSPGDLTVHPASRKGPQTPPHSHVPSICSALRVDAPCLESLLLGSLEQPGKQQEFHLGGLGS